MDGQSIYDWPYTPQPWAKMCACDHEWGPYIDAADFPRRICRRCGDETWGGYLDVCGASFLAAPFMGE